MRGTQKQEFVPPSFATRIAESAPPIMIGRDREDSGVKVNLQSLAAFSALVQGRNAALPSRKFY